MKARWLAVAAGVALAWAAGTAQAWTPPTPAQIADAVANPKSIGGLLDGATAPQAADTVKKVIDGIVALPDSMAVKRVRIVDLIANAVVAMGDQADEMMGLLAPLIPIDLLPLATASAVLASGAASPLIINAMLDAVKGDDARTQAITKAAQNPGAVLTGEEVSHIPLPIRTTIQAGEWMPLPTAKYLGQ